MWLHRQDHSRTKCTRLLLLFPLPTPPRAQQQPSQQQHRSAATAAATAIPTTIAAASAARERVPAVAEPLIVVAMGEEVLRCLIWSCEPLVLRRMERRQRQATPSPPGLSCRLLIIIVIVLSRFKLLPPPRPQAAVPSRLRYWMLHPFQCTTLQSPKESPNLPPLPTLLWRVAKPHTHIRNLIR